MTRGRFGFFIGEALRSLRTNFATTLAATVTVLIVLYLVGVGISLGSYVYNYTETVKKDLTLRVFLDDKAPQADKIAVGNLLRKDSRINRDTIEFVSKREAFLRMQQRLGKGADVLEYVPPGTFPASWEAKAVDANDLSAIAADLRGVRGLEQASGQENPKYGGQTSDRVLRVAGAIEVVIALVALTLVVAAVLLIGNTIRLSIFARRREVEVMKLVGATNWFVRWPFMLEGVICGALGALAATFLLLLSGRGLQRVLDEEVFEGGGTGSINLMGLAIILLVAGLSLGAAGSGLTMRKFLRV
jgi:cell division transport system permease protein